MTPDTTRRSEANKSEIRPVLLIALTIVAIFAQWTPNNFRPFLRFDSGIFLYVGEQLRQGAALYRGVWDHKPPLIFYLNELGLMFGSGSPAGVLAIDFLLVLVCFATAYRTLCRLFSRQVSLLATLFGLLLFFDITLHPNLGEVACLPLQAFALSLLLADLEGEGSIRRAALQGGIAAALFWFRPNGIAISLVYLATIGPAIFKSGGIRLLCRWTGAFVFAAAFCSLAVVIPAILRASWAELWFATYQFNRLYAGLATNVERLHTLLWLIFQTAQHGVILLAIAGLISILLVRTKLSTPRDRFRWAMLLWFVLEALFAAYTGKLYGKNAIPWILPSMSGVAIFFELLTGSDWDGRRTKRTLEALCGVVAGFLILSGASQWLDNAKRTQLADAPVIGEIRQLTSPADKVQYWGAFPMDTIFLAKRTSASRFFNSVPLMHGEPAYRQLAPTEIEELLRNEPKAIVERDDGQLPPLINTVYETNRADWDTPSLKASKAKLRNDYVLAWANEKTHTRIFIRR
jgi:hypothetical protein